MKKKWDEFSNMLKKIWDAFSDTFVVNLVLVFPLLYIVCNTWSVVIFHKELQKRGTILATKGYVFGLDKGGGGRGGSIPYSLLVEYKGILDTVYISNIGFGYYRMGDRDQDPRRDLGVNVVFLEENPERIIFEKEIMYPGVILFDWQCPLPPYKGLWRKVLWITFLIINVIGWVYTFFKVKKKNEIVVSDEK